jgi:ankyrin repeat protein
MRQLSTDLTRSRSQLDRNNGSPRFRHPNLPPLFYAVNSRNWAGVLRRCRTHPKELVCVEDTSGDSPLHYACRLNPPENVITALMPGCNIKNNEGATALHVAASHRCSANVIKLLVNTSLTKMSLTLSLTQRGRTPMHYACLSFRGLSIDAFKILLEATIDACASLEKSNEKIDDDFEWEADDDDDTSEEQVNAFTMQDHFGQTPLSLLFRRYRERVRCVIRDLDHRSASLSSAAATAAVHDELGGLWLKSRLIVCLMAERRREGHFSFNDSYEEASAAEAAMALEAARWAAKHHQHIYEEDEVESEDKDISPDLNTGRKFRLVHASVGLTGFGCPIEMTRLAISVYPNQVREMDEDGNLPLHIAAVASSFMPSSDSSRNVCSDEDSYISNLSNLSGLASDKHPPFDKVIRMLLRSYKMGAQTPHGQTGRLPLVLAIDARKRTMNDGLKALIEAYPAALESKNYDLKLYPHILSTVGKLKKVNIPQIPKKKEQQQQQQQQLQRFGKKKKKEMVSMEVIPVALYEVLRAKPNLLLEKGKNNNDSTLIV